MGMRNYLIEGVSGSGKTPVCDELERRGYHSVHGDRVLAYQGDPKTGRPLPGFSHENHIWDIKILKSLVSDKTYTNSFFCGGSRNFNDFVRLFDLVFVLEVNQSTLIRRLNVRSTDEWGGRKSERELILRLHATKEDLPKDGIKIDASAPINKVVDEILKKI